MPRGRKKSHNLIQDPKADEVTLGASGQEPPASGLTITLFFTGDFVINGADGAAGSYDDYFDTINFVNEEEIKFSYPGRFYRVPYRYSIPLANEWTYSGIADTGFVAPIPKTEGIHYYELGAARTDHVIETDPKEKWPDWSYDTAYIQVLIQRVESSTTVNDAINPTSIKLGRLEDGYTGDPTQQPTFSWTIVDKDGIPALSGMDTQPDMDEVSKLSRGNYTVTTTATELFPEGYENIDGNGESVSHTSTGTFSVTVGSVIVEHLDADTGEEIHPSETIVGTFKGDGYTTNPVNVSGYALVADPPNKTGVFTDTNQTVTYKYEKVMTQVKVEHVYEDGTEVPAHPPTITTGHATIETLQTNQLRQNDLIIVDVKVDDFSQGNTSDYLVIYPPSGVTTVTYIYKEKGSLVLLSAPSLQFGTHVIAGTTMIYPLTQDAVLSVQDDRVTTNNWKVSAKASMLTEVNGTRTLDPDALGFMDNGNLLSLKESRIVWESSTIPINPIQSKTWQEGNAGVGFVVKLHPFQASAASYSAVITWSLGNTP